MNWIEIMGGVVGGSGLATLIQYFRDTKKDRSDEVFRVIEQYKELINQHKSQISKMEKAEEECKFRLGKHENIIEELRVTIIELRNKMIQLETTNNDFPFPCWFKDMNHAMIWVNPACHEMIYKPNGFEEHDYIGKTDKEVWGEELGLGYQKTDKQSGKNRGAIITTNEKVMIKNLDMSEHWKVVKWVRYLGTTPIGYCGAAIPYEGK